MWRQSRKYVKAVLNLITAAVILLFVVFVVPSVISYFMPFVIGWIIAMIANPLVRFLDEKIKIRRKAGSAIVIIAVIAVIVAGIYGILSLLAGQLKGFVEELPGLWKAMESDISNAGSSLESFSHYFSPNVQDQVARVLNSLMNLLSSAVDHLGSPTVSAVGMCLLSSYFFVAQREEVIAAFRKYVPESFRKKWDVMYHSLTGAIGGYFKAQLKIEIWVYLLMLVGFLILRVRYGALISIGIAILDFLPVFGTGTVLWPWAVIKVLGGDFKMAIGLLIIWGVGQLLRQLIQPKIVGDSIGVPPLPTLFLIFIGYKVGSVAGMILAVPAGIIVANMYQAGFFDTTMDSVRILVHGFNRFRRLTPEDKAEISEKKE